MNSRAVQMLKIAVSAKGSAKYVTKLPAGGSIEIYEHVQQGYFAVVHLTERSVGGRIIGEFGTVRETLEAVYEQPLPQFRLQFQFLKRRNTLHNYLALRSTIQWREASKKAQVIHTLNHR
jgi:hypothetical protein